MKHLLFRSYALLVALTLGGCLENVTVGRETQPLKPPDPGAIGADGGTDPSPIGDDSGVDGGVDRDGGNTGPCDPIDCEQVFDPMIQKTPDALCATGEPLTCMRDETGTCALLCPAVPDKQQCNSPVHIVAADGGSDGTCQDGEFCRYDLGGCGGGIGACTPIPESCDTLEEPVCGCDDQTYPNLCSMLAAGISPKSVGPCP